MEISDDLLETLDISLHAMGRALLRDVSEILRIPSKDLIAKIYGPNGTMTKKSTQNQGETAATPDNHCKVLVKHNETIATICMAQTKENSSFCSKHYLTPVPLNLTVGIPLMRLQGFPDYFATSAEKGYVLDRSGNAVGVMKAGAFYKFPSPQ